MAAELRWERSVDQRQRALLTRSRSTCRRARDVARPWRRHTSCDAVSIPVLCPRRGPGPTLGPDQNRRDGRATLSTTERSVTQAARFVTLRSFRVLPDHPAGTYGRVVHQERPRDLARRRCSKPAGPTRSPQGAHARPGMRFDGPVLHQPDGAGRIDADHAVAAAAQGHGALVRRPLTATAVEVRHDVHRRVRAGAPRPAGRGRRPRESRIRTRPAGGRDTRRAGHGP